MQVEIRRRTLDILILCNRLLEIVLLLKMLKAIKKNLRRWWVKPHISCALRDQFGFYSLLFTYFKINDEEEFERLMRMKIHQFDTLLNLVRVHLEKQSVIRVPLCPELRLAITLHYLAHAGSLATTASIYRIGKSTIYVIIKETCTALVEVLKPRHLPTPDERKWLQIAEEYYEKYNFPNCLGAIDGKQIQIRKPSNSGSLFRNYNKYDSIVLLASCDAKCRFTWYNIGDYGSYSDASIFNACDLGQEIINSDIRNVPMSRQLPNTNTNLPFVFLGDEIFPLCINFMKPFPRRHGLNIEQRVFNYRLSRARWTIESAFGILCAKWSIFSIPITFDVDNTDIVVAACVCLHNFIIDTNNDMNNYENVARPNVIRTQLNAVQVRNEFSNYFSSPAGAVPWQYNYI